MWVDPAKARTARIARSSHPNLHPRTTLCSVPATAFFCRLLCYMGCVSRYLATAALGLLIAVAITPLPFAAAQGAQTAKTPANPGLKSGATAAVQAQIVPPKLLKFVPAKYPRELLAKGLRGAVVLHLALDRQGAVTKVTVVKGAGPLFDAAAIEAGKQLQFTPALLDGKPVPVAIRYRYRFMPETLMTRRGHSRSLGRYERREHVWAFEGFASVTGTLLERGTGRPLVGAVVHIPKLDKEALTDTDGMFRFGVLPKGKHRLYVPGADHKPVRVTVDVQDGRTTTLILRPERKSYTLYRATAKAPPQPGEMARRSLSAEEIQRIPGVYGDSFRVVQNLPGVARAGGGLLVVRGSAPFDTQMFIEGQRVQVFYHFGGLYSILNTDILEGVDFTAGGYPLRYGRGMGGVLTARLAIPKDERWNGYIETNVFHTGALIKGPINKDTHLAVAGRRSYIDAILGAVVPDGVLPFSQAPRYWDWQLKVDHRINPRTNLTAMAYGSADGVKALIDTPPSAFPDLKGDLENDTGFNAVLAVLRHDGGDWTSKTMAGVLWGGGDIRVGNLFKVEGGGQEVTVRQDFQFGKGPLAVRTGLDLYVVPFQFNAAGPAVAFTGERGTIANPPSGLARAYISKSEVIAMPGVYVDAVFRLNPQLEVVPGVRVDLFRGLGNGESLTPRLNARYIYDNKLTLKAATGTTSQPAQPPQYFEDFGNPNLLPAFSWETAGGFEYKITDWIDLDALVFYKDQWNLHVASQDLVPTVGNLFNNDGTGTIYGFEALLRHTTHGRFFGWISYTLQRATRVDHPGDPARLFGWDQTHIVTALGSYKLANNWEVGFRFRLTSGNPQTALSTAVYNEQNDTYTRIRSTCVNCTRLPAFHQLDLRIDKKWVYDRWMLNLYLDVQNVYNRMNPTFVSYNFDASKKAFGVGLPIIPSLGMRAEF